MPQLGWRYQNYFCPNLERYGFREYERQRLGNWIHAYLGVGVLV